MPDGTGSSSLTDVTVWGKTGSRPGYTDGVFASRDLSRHMVYAFTPTIGDQPSFTLGLAAAALDPGLAAGT